MPRRVRCGSFSGQHTVYEVTLGGRANNGAYIEAKGPGLRALFNGLMIPRIQKSIYEDTHPTPLLPVRRSDLAITGT